MNGNQHCQVTVQNKKVLCFNDDSVVESPYSPPPLLIIPTPCKERLVEENSFNFDLTENIAPDVPKSVELINTVPKITEKNDILHPTTAANQKIKNNFCDRLSDDKPFVKVTPNGNINKTLSKGINWDELLDSELLVNLPTNQKEIKERKAELFHIRFPDEKISSTETNTILDCKGDKKSAKKNEKRKTKTSTESKAKKIRNDSNLIQQHQRQTEPGKEINKNNSLRKQNYTKAVKNWLNNVEPHNPVDENIDNVVNETHMEPIIVFDKSDVDNIDENALVNKTSTNKGTIVIDKTLKVKTLKKVVQAQLANKDGVMKFSKPKTNNEVTQKPLDVQQSKAKDNKNTKVKKFNAPIKSQIPVKDVTYDVYEINEDNIESNRGNLLDIKNNEIVALLLYSNGFNQLNSHHTDGTCNPDGVIIGYDDLFYCFKGFDQNYKETFKHLLENNKLVCYDGRSLLMYLTSHLQMEINSINIFDAKIGGSLLDPDNSPANFSDLQKLLSFTASFTIATECVLQKCAWYMTLLKQCWVKLCAMLHEDSLWNVFVEIEMKLLPIVVEMELRGVCIDLAKLKAMEEVLLTRMKLVEQQCYKAAGKVFQINSTVQVRAILYDELQLDTKCNVKIRETICKGAKSTSETMLRSLMSEHPLPKLILEYRHLHKAHATFVAGIAQHVKDGVIRPTWDQMAAATGRIASNNPNLQAIPKAPFNLVMFSDASDGADVAQLLFRSVYVSRPGHWLLAADFQQVECRVFAHAAADSALLLALAAPGDLFRVLAATWLKKPEAEIVSEERERTKRLVYASLYGAGTRKLMDILDVDYQQALQVAASFNRTFPCLKSFGAGVVSRCVAAGGRLATPRGRVRRVQYIDSDDFARKTHAERQAVNFIVQGTAADLCKTAMILTQEQLRSSSPSVEAHLLLQIHDELVWEVPDQHLHAAAAIIRQVMEGCGRGGGVARLPVALSAGTHWGNMQPYTPPERLD